MTMYLYMYMTLESTCTCACICVSDLLTSGSPWRKCRSIPQETKMRMGISFKAASIIIYGAGC